MLHEDQQKRVLSFPPQHDCNIFCFLCVFLQAFHELIFQKLDLSRITLRSVHTLIKLGTQRGLVAGTWRTSPLVCSRILHRILVAGTTFLVPAI